MTRRNGVGLVLQNKVQVPWDKVQVPRDKVQVQYSRRWRIFKANGLLVTVLGMQWRRCPLPRDCGGSGAAKEGLVGLELGPVQGDVSRDRSFCFCFVFLKTTRDVSWIKF